MPEGFYVFLFSDLDLFSGSGDSERGGEDVVFGELSFDPTVDAIECVRRDVIVDDALSADIFRDVLIDAGWL